MTTKGNQTVRGETVENQKERILAQLCEVGAAGVTKTRLGVKGPKGKAAQALEELLSDRRVANLGSPTRPCYVLSEHSNPLERACEQIERNALAQKAVRGDVLELFAKKELQKGCQGEVRKKVEEAIDWLVKEKRLVKLRRRRSFFWASGEKLQALLIPETAPIVDVPETRPRPSPSQPASALDRTLVQAAYRRLKSRLGYSNVEISELQCELGIPMEDLKRFLLEESRQGYAVLSLGDWSVSSEAIRAGAIDLFGRPHLLVRLDAE